jgi:ribonuclease-3
VAAAFEPRIQLASETRIDFKSALQELLARRGARVSYEVIAATGPPHRRTFEVAAIVDSERVGSGEGRSKKAAEQVAAEQALAALDG